MSALFDLMVRSAKDTDAPLLPDIERSAARAFHAQTELGWTPGNFVISVEDHLNSIARGMLWVAEEKHQIVGFLTANIAGSELHIDEFNVHFEYQHRGVGRKLMELVKESARKRGLEAITLTTFRGVPWNEHFYAGVGFSTLQGAKIGSRLQKILEREVQHGLPREKRCAMRMTLRR